METRTKHTYAVAIYEFARNILVECPNCAGKALVKVAETTQMAPAFSQVKLVCSNCGHNKTLENISKRQDPKQKQGKILIYGAPIDPYFHLPVWLQMEFSGEVLWAYNMDHLQFLAEHVGAKLRERSGANRNRSIASRLPRWMTSAGNREAVLQAIDKLKKK
jgi:DNA-directed RNA polymerase subunit RPC12/RpoP